MITTQKLVRLFHQADKYICSSKSSANWRIKWLSSTSSWFTIIKLWKTEYKGWRWYKIRQKKTYDWRICITYFNRINEKDKFELLEKVLINNNIPYTIELWFKDDDYNYYDRCLLIKPY